MGKENPIGLGARVRWYPALRSSLLTELTDKTQKAMVALVAGTGALWSVFLGGTLALWTVSLIGILLGSTLLRRIRKDRMLRGAAILFMVFGVLAIEHALVDDSPLRTLSGSLSLSG